MWRYFRSGLYNIIVIELNSVIPKERKELAVSGSDYRLFHNIGEVLAHADLTGIVWWFLAFGLYFRF